MPVVKSPTPTLGKIYAYGSSFTLYYYKHIPLSFYNNMPSIEVANPQKIFKIKRKAAGLSGSIRALVRPEYSAIE